MPQGRFRGSLAASLNLGLAPRCLGEKSLPGRVHPFFSLSQQLMSNIENKTLQLASSQNQNMPFIIGKIRTLSLRPAAFDPFGSAQLFTNQKQKVMHPQCFHYAQNGGLTT